MSDTPRSVPPVTPCLQEALERADEELAYHGKRMDKRLRRLRDEPPLPMDEEEITRKMVMPDPFPAPPRPRHS